MDKYLHNSQGILPGVPYIHLIIYTIYSYFISGFPNAIMVPVGTGAEGTASHLQQGSSHCIESMQP